MLILALAIFTLAVWLFVKRGRPVHPAARAAGLAFLIVCAAVVALRAGPVGTAVFATAAVLLGVWLSLRGRGGDDHRDDRPDAPDPPDPDPGSGERAELLGGVLDPEAFDRARGEWERELPKRG